MAESLADELVIDQQVVEFQEAPDQVPLPADDEDMEEGEVNEVHPSRNPIKITIHNKEQHDLPDLLQEISGSGIDRHSAERMEARAKRFNLQTPNIHYDDIIKLYKSIGIPASEYEGRVNPNDRQHRLEAIHVRGFDGRKIKSDDIYAYFKEHDLAPVSFEWVDANSANVIWALGSSSAKALLTLSRPIVVPHRNEDEASMEDDDMVLVRKADEYNSDKENSDDDDGTLDENQRRVEAEKRKERKIREKLLPKFEMPGDPPICLSELGDTVNLQADYSKWRLGRPSETLGNRIFMRIATKQDAAMEDTSRSFKSGADTANRILRNSGGLLSTSRKRKLQEQMAAQKSAAEEYELTSKRYSGPVGKNPWGTIAEDWGQGRNSGKRDFADELGELANMVSKRGRKVDISSRLGSHQTVKPVDWDAPETHEKRLEGFGDDHQDADSESEDTEDDKWNRKLKRPRMSMVADEVEQKVSAKHRLHASSKRKKKDRPAATAPAARENLVMSIKTDRHILASRVGRGLSDKLKSRLGARPAEEVQQTKRSFEFIRQRRSESLESLDREGDPLPNMVIQVTQSPQRASRYDDDDDEDMDVEAEHAVHSTVTKIKTERGEEERKMKVKRDRERQDRRERERRERELEKDRRDRNRERERAERHGRRGPDERRRDERKTSRPSSGRLRIKKEKTSDDERKKKQRRGRTPSSDSSTSESSSSDDSSSDDSSSEDSSSESSSSSSDSSGSSSSSSSSDDGRSNRRHVKSKKASDRRPVKSRGDEATKRSSGGKSDSKGLNDKLQDYLKKAKERQKRDGKKK